MGTNRILRIMITEDTRSAFSQMMIALVSTAFSIAVVVCALYAAGTVFELNKGKNYSDVGVPMYTNSVGAASMGLLTYVGIIIISPVIIWKITKSKIFLYTYCVINFFNLMFVFLIFGMITS